jgi:hypothetical protein
VAWITSIPCLSVLIRGLDNIDSVLSVLIRGLDNIDSVLSVLIRGLDNIDSVLSVLIRGLVDSVLSVAYDVSHPVTSLPCFIAGSLAVVCYSRCA